VNTRRRSGTVWRRTRYSQIRTYRLSSLRRSCIGMCRELQSHRSPTVDTPHCSSTAQDGTRPSRSRSFRLGTRLHTYRYTNQCRPHSGSREGMVPSRTHPRRSRTRRLRSQPRSCTHMPPQRLSSPASWSRRRLRRLGTGPRHTRRRRPGTLLRPNQQDTSSCMRRPVCQHYLVSLRILRRFRTGKRRTHPHQPRTANQSILLRTHTNTPPHRQRSTLRANTDSQHHQSTHHLLIRESSY